MQRNISRSKQRQTTSKSKSSQKFQKSSKIRSKSSKLQKSQQKRQISTIKPSNNIETDPLLSFSSPHYNNIETVSPILRNSLLHTSNLLQNNEISAIDLVNCSNQQIFKTSNTNAYISTFPDQSLTESKQSHTRLINNQSLSPLDGIPIAIKDNIHVKDRKTTAGSQFLKNMISPYDATVTSRLRSAGAIIVGKTNLDEFGMGSYGINSSFGPTLSNFGTKKILKNGENSENFGNDNIENSSQFFLPGGSSSGSAVALQQYTVFASIGTDTGGSVRLPAAFTGTVGFKPTYGALSRYGLIAYGSSFDCPGIMTRTVSDAKIVFDIIAGPDDNDSTCIFDVRNAESHFPNLTKLLPKLKFSTQEKNQRQEKLQNSQDKNLENTIENNIEDTLSIDSSLTNSLISTPFKGLKVGIPAELMFSDLNQEIKKIWSNTANLFTQLGAEIYTVSLPSLSHCLPVYYTLAQSEAVSNLARYDGLRYGGTHYSNENNYEISFYKKKNENEPILDEIDLDTPGQLHQLEIKLNKDKEILEKAYKKLLQNNESGKNNAGDLEGGGSAAKIDGEHGALGDLGDSGDLGDVNRVKNQLDNIQNEIQKIQYLKSIEKQKIQLEMINSRVEIVETAGNDNGSPTNHEVITDTLSTTPTESTGSTSLAEKTSSTQNGTANTAKNTPNGKKPIPNITPLQKLYSTNRELFFGTEVKQRLMVGNYVLSSLHYNSYIEKAMNLRQETILEFLDLTYSTQISSNIRHTPTISQMNKVDIILCPTSTTLPHNIDQFINKNKKNNTKINENDTNSDDKNDEMSAYIDDVMTVFANIIGAPALSLPVAAISSQSSDLSRQNDDKNDKNDENKPNQQLLPVGMQIIGAPGSDIQLLDIGTVLQQHVKL